jgi:hypothetical protein
MSESKALEARDAETAENAIPTLISEEEIRSIHELELAKIDEEYARNPSQKLLDERLKILCNLMKERRQH